MAHARGNPWTLAPVLGAAYAIQGCVAGFFAFVALPYAAASGLSLQAQAGVLSLGSLPWVLKLVWAPWLDRWARAGAAVVVNLLAVVAVAIGLALLLRAWSAPTLAWSLAGLWFAIQVALSLQDVAVDALALDRVPPQERGQASAWLAGGHHVGFHVLAGLALGAVAAKHGVPRAGFVAIGIVLALAVPSLHLLRGSPSSSDAAKRAQRTPILAALPRPLPWLLVVGALVADVATSTVSTELLVRELHWDPAELARVLPIPLLLASLAGFCAAAFVVDRLGHDGAVGLCSALLGILWGGFGLLRPYWSEVAFLVAIVVVQAIVTAIFYVAMQAWMMDRADPRLRVTTFAIWAVAFNLPRVFAPWIAPGVLSLVGWPGFFGVCGVYQLAYGVVFWRVSRQFFAVQPTAPGSPGML